MNISRIQIVLTHTMDYVVIHTDLPCPLPPAALPSQEPLALMFHAPKDGGEEYVKRVFGIQPEIIHARH